MPDHPEQHTSYSHSSAIAMPYPAGVGSVALLVGTSLAVLCQLYAAIALMLPVGADFHGDAALALSTMFTFSYATGFLIWGPIAGRYGRKRVMLIGLSVLVVATAVCAIAPSLPVLGVMRALQGFAASSFPPVALTYVSEAVHPARRQGAIGAMSTGFLVAGILGQVIAQVVSQTVGWPWMFLGSAVVLIACAIVIGVVIQETHQQGHSGSLIDQFAAIGRLCMTRKMVFLCGANITTLFVFVAMYTALGSHLTTLGYSNDTVLLIRAIGLPGMFFALAHGVAVRWLGGLIAVARAGLLLAATGIVLMAIWSDSLLGIAVASTIVVIGVAINIPSMIGLFIEASASQRSAGMAINGVVIFTGASLGPILATTGMSFGVLMIVLAVILGVGALSVSVTARHMTT
ncbi:MFS transporter [Stomatohabitans albus]|uniref:MFS transporter n=1 Tax=Stomatohabitans albus TaxID=3110766 RepID=UPI00300D3A95